ncbi:MAG: YbaB/EbfC family nucleoid-associated protein [Acidimicrobiales bacterium]
MTAEGEGPDLGALLAQVGQMQQGIQAAQAQAAGRVVEGTSGGGAVRVRVTGGMDFESVTIDPGVVDPDEVELLADLVLAAIRDAVDRANQAQADALGGLGLGVPGGLHGLLGGS